MTQITATTAINFRETYFIHPTLTKIQGEPTYHSLQLLSQELKANAASVPSNLGGGNYGYLGLLLSDAQFALLSNTPFVHPVHPGTLTIAPTLTGPQIAAAKQTYEDAVKIHRECIALERALIQQTVEAIDKEYLQATRNRQTGQYATHIRDLLQYLFSTYGNITPTDLDLKADQVKKLTYDITNPIDSIFNEIEELSEYAEAAETPYSPNQLIDIGYIIISKNMAFQQDVRAWLRRPKADHTWSNFKTHFRAAYKEIKRTQGPTTDSHGYANAIADLVLQKLQIPTEDEYLHLQTDSQGQAAPAQDKSQLEELATLMKQMLNTMSNQQRNTTQNQSNQRDQRTNNRNKSNSKKNVKLYCWTHGACAHDSAACNKPAEGHQTDATFTNMKQGSTKNCFWLQTSQSS